MVHSWRAAKNLLAYAAAYDPMRPPSARSVLQMIQSSAKTLENVGELIAQCEQRGIGAGEMPLPRSIEEERQELEDVIAGLRLAWQSHHVQRALDAVIRDGDRA